MTNLKLDRTGAALVKGESYYAVGVRDDNLPFRSETVECLDDGRNPVFEGVLKFPARPANFVPRGREKQTDSETDILIQYTNYSSTQFALSTWGYSLQEGFGSLTASPGPILQALAGQQSIGANQILGAVDEGPADIILCWAAGTSFGVWIHFNFQMFGHRAAADLVRDHQRQPMGAVRHRPCVSVHLGRRGGRLQHRRYTQLRAQLVDGGRGDHRSQQPEGVNSCRRC